MAYNYSSLDDRSLTFTVNSDKPASETFGNGSSVRYTVTADTTTVVVTDSAASGPATVTWDRDTKAGSHTRKDGTYLVGYGTVSTGKGGRTGFRRPYLFLSKRHA